VEQPKPKYLIEDKSIKIFDDIIMDMLVVSRVGTPLREEIICKDTGTRPYPTTPQVPLNLKVSPIINNVSYFPIEKNVSNSISYIGI